MRERTCRGRSRAVRYRAFSLWAVKRILAATARPKSLLETMANEARERLEQLPLDPPVRRARMVARVVVAIIHRID